MLLILVWVQSPVWARPDYKVALKGGPNASTLSRENRVFIYGFSGGIAGQAQWFVTDRLWLSAQTELLYTPRGAAVRIDGNNLGQNREYYLDTAIVFRPEVRLGLFSAYLLVGGGFDILLSANQEDASGMERDITDLLRRTDLALLVGAGGGYHFSRQSRGLLCLDTVFLEVRHDRGMLDTDNLSDSAQNRTIALMLGLSFRLGPRDPMSKL